MICIIKIYGKQLKRIGLKLHCCCSFFISVSGILPHILNVCGFVLRYFLSYTNIADSVEIFKNKVQVYYIKVKKCVILHFLYKPLRCYEMSLLNCVCHEFVDQPLLEWCGSENWYLYVKTHERIFKKISIELIKSSEIKFNFKHVFQMEN